MKQRNVTVLIALIGLFVSAAASRAVPVEVSANLLSTIQRESSGSSSDMFSVSFGALNGGRASLLSSYESASAFATWYGANSRTILDWGSVQGSLITDNNSFYKYFGADTSVTTRVGGPLESKYDSTKDNRALAFVTYSNGSDVLEVGLFDLGYDFGNPASGPLGGFEFLTLSTDATPIYGAANPSSGSFGSLSTTATIPEPSSSLLLLVGGIALVGVRQFRKKI